MIKSAIKFVQQKSFKNFQSLVISSIVILSVAGCSSFGKKGSGEDGEGGLSEADLNAQREGRFGSGSIPTAEGEGFFRDVHFDYDSAAISDQARQDIEYNAQLLQANPDVKSQVEGHSDERGTNEYNMALGQSRARAVQEALLAAGIASSRLSVISYGEEVPLDQGHNESAWAKNRRAHLSAYREEAR